MKKIFLLILTLITLSLPTISFGEEQSAPPPKWERTIDVESGHEVYTLTRGQATCSVSYHEHLVRLSVRSGEEILHLGHFTRAGVRPAGEPVKGDVLAAFRTLNCHYSVAQIESKQHRCDYMMVVAPYGPREYDRFRCTKNE